MFHIAYFIGSYIATNYVLDYDTINKNENDIADPKDILLQLRIAHLSVPLFNWCSYCAYERGYFVLDQTFEAISIINYQVTIFYAQFY